MSCDCEIHQHCDNCDPERCAERPTDPEVRKLADELARAYEKIAMLEGTLSKREAELERMSAVPGYQPYVPGGCRPE